MHRIIWLSVGGRKFHLLKLSGAFFLFAFVLMALGAAYQVFVTVNKAIYAQAKPELIVQLFGWSISAPYNFTGEDVVGVLLGPIAIFLFWLALATMSLIVYQTGKVVLPLEEYEKDIPEHHRKLIAIAKRAHARGFRKR